jgi:predicted ribosome quality control (RQC) complex YloA/Tae2 family protein
MESFSYFELKSFAQWLQNEMHGAQLQDLWTNGQLLIFQFYKFKDLFLVVDTDPRKPGIVFLEQAPKIEKRPKPLILFLHSHGKNLRWDHCQVESEKGRVIDIELSGGTRRCHLEIRLIPNAFNILVETADKKIAWEKPRELPPSIAPTEETPAVEKDWRAVGTEWLESRQTRNQAQAATKKATDQRVKDLEKKSRALSAIEDGLKADPSKEWTELGESLKVPGEIPTHLQTLYKANQSRNWNMENAFAQAKSLKKKRAGTEERAEKLRAEIQKLQRSIEEHPDFQPAPAQHGSSAGNRIFKKSEAKGRRLQLDENFEALMGKSARDNLSLLRQAQAWDLWMHLKDYPGSHAIIVRPRQKEVPLKWIQKVSEWLIRETIGQKKIEMGAKYDVVVVECRYVRPIKGDKLGRVTYHNPQVYSFASKA